MKYRHFLRIDEGSLPARDFEQICALAPKARKAYGFDLWLDNDTPDGGEVIRAIITICSRQGLERRRVIGPGHYGYYVERVYGEDEYRCAEFLILDRQPKVQGLIQVRGINQPERDEQGRLILLGRNTKASITLARIFPNHIIVSNRVREILEAAQFVGLRFGEVAIKGTSTPAGTQPFWELQSSLVLPKLANTDRLMYYGWRDEPPRPFDGDYSRCVFIHDPPFSKGEVHYRRSDLTQIAPFDIARTLEFYMETHPALVISQRFYQHCLTNNISLDVDRVLIDPERPNQPTAQSPPSS